MTGKNSLTLVTEEGTGDVQLLATDNDDALTGESLLSNNGGEATQEMAFTVDDNHLVKAKEVDKWDGRCWLEKRAWIFL